MCRGGFVTQRRAAEGPLPRLGQRFRAVVDFCGGMQNSAQGWTAVKNYERDGGGSGSGTAPSSQSVPVLPAGFPAAAAPGIVGRFRALAKRIPAAPTKWTYRGIYIVGDAPVGVWSKPVSVTVGG